MIGRVLLVGDELLGGAASDRNTAVIAAALGARGVALAGAETVGDERPAIRDAIRRLAPACDVLVLTGGLGPTDDDLTREALADALDVPLVEDGTARGWIEARYAERQLAPGPSARRQARLPDGATPVANPLGTAPGIRARLGDCRIYALPGVPAEVAGMIGAVASELGVLPDGHGWERIVATLGVGEVRVAERLDAAGFAAPDGLRLAFLPGPGGVRLRLAAPGGAPDAILDAADAEIRRILGDWALPGPTLAESLVRRFAASGTTLTSAESCTGGLIGARITDVPGSSSVYLGGLVAYANPVKVRALGVDEGVLERHGAVSEPVVRAMAEGARARFAATVAVAVTGVAGPGGGTAEKPVGTVWIAAADARGTEAAVFRFPGSREMVRERTVQKALEMAYRRGTGTAT